MIEWQWIMQSVMMIMIAIIGFFLKRTIDGLQNKDKEIIENIAELRRETIEGFQNRDKGFKDDIARLRDETRTEINTIRQETEEFKQKLPYIFTLREDTIRWNATIEHKLDKIYELLHQIAPPERSYK
jgi:cell shape-determining protein MreC